MAKVPNAQQDADDAIIGPNMGEDVHDDATVGPDFEDATVGPDMDDDESEDAGIGHGAGRANTVTNGAASDEEDLTVGVIDEDDRTVGPDMDDDDEFEDAAIGYGTGTPNTVTDAPDVDEDDLTIGIDGNVRDDDDGDMTVMGNLTAADEGPPADSNNPLGVDDRTILGDSVAAEGATQIGGDANDDDQTVFTDIEEKNVGQTNVGQTRGSKTRFGKTRFSKAGTRNDDGNSQSGRSGKGQGGKQPTSEGPRYDMVDNFARGGMGKIWLAKDGMIQREVAYKELLPRAMRRSSIVKRFIQEAQVTGQLEHPGIVPIYDLGYQEDGTPFYAMKLVRGSEMKEQIEALHEMPKNTADRHRAFVKLLGQFVDVCNSLAFAHQRGVLHRDLKPQNVMIGGFGETLVLDWGLAKLLGRSEPGASDQGVQVTGKYDDEFSPELDDDQSDPGAASSASDASGTTVSAESTRVTGNSETDTTNIVGNDDVGATNIVDKSEAGKTRTLGAGKIAMNKTTAPAEKPVEGSVAPASGKSQGQHGESQTVKSAACSEGTRTRYGSVMGTLAYMPPEQAEGKFDEMDARTDIYFTGSHPLRNPRQRCAHPARQDTGDA